MLEAAQTYINSANTDKWFALLGASGSGKTHLCSAVCYHLLRHGKEVYYMQWREDVRKIMQDQYNGSRDLLDLVKTVGVLYIDDLFKTARDPEGKQKPSEAETRLAFEIINSRYTAKKKTIISSESLMSDLAKIDEAIAGRIKQMCGYYLVNIHTVKEENRNYRMLD
jgi:DNA replication protein DnaC